MKPCPALVCASLAGFSHLTTASTFPPEPTGLTQVASQRWPGATISYKKTTVCETTPGVNAWSGYIHLPLRLLSQVEHMGASLDANMFFWYFESRNDPANSPTSLFLGGGPGYTSLDPTSGFPCNINPDSNSTTLNPFSWNNNVNMLYVEQPVGTGFSYQTRVNGTFDIISGNFSPALDVASIETNATVLAATLDPRNPLTTVNTTKKASRMMWQFSQVFFQEFPEWRTSQKEISLWANSYGGFWGVDLLDNLLTQNEHVLNGTHPNKNATVIPIGTLGLGNACIDPRAELFGRTELGFHNTYGTHLYNESEYDFLRQLIVAPNNGCYAKLDVCHAVRDARDPYGMGNNETVNAACAEALETCSPLLKQNSNYSNFDVTQPSNRNDVENYYTGFFNQQWVQQDLGARVNFTQNNLVMQKVMIEGIEGIVNTTADIILATHEPLDRLLRNGVKLTMVYGDRDYQCNWRGAENVTMVLDYPAAESFRAAGYADVVTNASYIGGLVRQHGNVSFTRLFNAGHAFAAFQPETVFRIFQRSMTGLDIATGLRRVDDTYSTTGMLDIVNVSAATRPPSKETTCYLYTASEGCTEEQLAALLNGTAVVKDFVVMSPRGNVVDQNGNLVSAASGNGTGNGVPIANSAACAGNPFSYMGLLLAVVALL